MLCRPARSPASPLQTEFEFGLSDDDQEQHVEALTVRLYAQQQWTTQQLQRCPLIAQLHAAIATIGHETPDEQLLSEFHQSLLYDAEMDCVAEALMQEREQYKHNNITDHSETPQSLIVSIFTPSSTTTSTKSSLSEPHTPPQIESNSRHLTTSTPKTRYIAPCATSRTDRAIVSKRATASKKIAARKKAAANRSGDEGRTGSRDMCVKKRYRR